MDQPCATEEPATVPVALVRRLALGAVPLIFGLGFLVGILVERWQAAG